MTLECGVKRLFLYRLRGWLSWQGVTPVIGRSEDRILLLAKFFYKVSVEFGEPAARLLFLDDSSSLLLLWLIRLANISVLD